jgi:hypothetical protein
MSNPDTGEELLPINKQIVELWKAQTEKRKQQEARRVPKSVDLEKYSPFDSITGEARVWYRKSENGDFEFYDWSGFDPQSGEKLSLITHEVVAEWQKHPKEPALPRCYVITRDGVRYGDNSGLDATKARVWYWRSEEGGYEFYNNFGYHPRTGDKLNVFTKEDLGKYLKDLELLDKKRKEAVEQENHDKASREEEKRIEGKLHDRRKTGDGNRMSARGKPKLQSYVTNWLPTPATPNG